MLEIIVEKQGGDFSTVTEAIEAVPYDEKALIRIGEGVFTEKVFCEKKDITFEGAGIGRTVIEYSDGAADLMPDGTKKGTFRSYTAFFGGRKVTVRNMTIANNCGDGRLAGQGLAVYADADICFFENVRMEGHQDTLFCSPLPRAEKKVGGFLGPRVMTERRLTSQYYKDCEITGDVDFIFGGADAVFDNCTITVNNREIVKVEPGSDAAKYKPSEAEKQAKSETKEADKPAKLDKDQININERFINGYVTAGCGRSCDLGMVFRKCTVKGAEGCAPGSVFLGRPWREEAKAVFIDCTMDETIAPERFSGWGGVGKEEPETFYGEFGTVNDKGEAADLSKKNAWVKDVTGDMASELSSKAEKIVSACTLL